MMGVNAQNVSESDARIKAMQFLNGTSARSRQLTVSPLQLNAVESNTKGVYAFNIGDNEGFILVSGDERTLPILGYTDSGSFDPNNAPANFKAWMKGYEQAIAGLQDAKLTTTYANSIDEEPYGDSIEPLVKARWSQDAPYNYLCPIINKELSVTGCPATAMAQIMNYWKWPKVAVPAVPAYTTASLHRVEALDFTFIDWDNICDTYNPEDKRTAVQDTAVARLMRYCGQAMEMDYSPDVSGSFESFFPTVLKYYFNYSESVRFLQRTGYSTKDWETTLYTELAEGRPVGYAGYSDGGGHSFVCDGYDKKGLFHINWGWSGICDGYFLLSILNPYDNTGTGASATGLGYCMAQEMIIGIEPAKGIVGERPYLQERGFMEMAGELVSIRNVHNVSGRKGVFAVALGTIDDPLSLNPVVNGVFASKNYANVEANAFTSIYFTPDSVHLAPGEYKLYPMQKCMSIIDDWHRFTNEDQYVLVTVDEKKNAKFTIYPQISMKVNRAEVTKPALFNQDVKFNITNTSPINYSDILYLKLTYKDHHTRSKKSEPVTQEAITGAYIDAGATNDVIFNFAPVCGGEVEYALCSSNDTNTPITTGTMYIEEPSEVQLNALRLTDYAIAFDYDDNYCYITASGKLTNVSDLAINANPFYLLGLDNPDDIECEYDTTYGSVVQPGSTKKFEFPQMKIPTVGAEMPDDPSYEMLFGFSNHFSSVYPDQVLLLSKLRKGMTLTPEGYKETPTALHSVSAANGKVIIFDLLGRPVKNTDAKGMYIINGKKVIK